MEITLKLNEAVQSSINKISEDYDKSIDDIIKEALSQYIYNNRSENVLIKNAEEIILKVCNFYNVSVDKVTSRKKYREFILPRYIIADMLYSDKMLKMSLSQIGRILGNRDHTTIIHSLRTIDDMCATDLDFRKQYHDLYILIYGNDYNFKYTDKYFEYSDKKYKLK